LRPGEEPLQRIVADILQEIEEQMCVKDIPPVAPLATLSSMMKLGWVWGCIPLVLFSDG